ncbi:MAG: FAD-binding oxidoreductase, partial [Acetobacteraceae bacterium]
MGAESVLARLREAFGERVFTTAALRETHAHGEDSYPPHLPDAVVFADCVEDISRTLALCNEQRIPVVAFGAGTSLEGHVTPVAGGISLDLSRMNRILSVNEPDLDCRVEAGVTRQQINAALRDRGLFFPVDPGSECTIGGMCATRASGTCAVRYGTIRENVLGLTAVMADGRVVNTGGRVRKSATGYDLTRLLIGSEGTLGVIAEVQLRLWGIPEATMAATCSFATLDDAVQTVIAVMQAGIPVARIELLDEAQMEACIAYSHLEQLQPLPTLFLEFHGSEAGVTEQAAAVGEIAAEYGGARFATARESEARNRLWKARHDAYWAVRAWRRGFRHLVTDVVVP